MGTPPGRPAAAQTEFDLLGALFSPAGRADPHVILRGSLLPGFQHLFVRDVLCDPRFAAAAIPPSPDPAFQLMARRMIRLDGLAALAPPDITASVPIRLIDHFTVTWQQD